MATIYPGNSAAAQAPSPAPSVNADPQVSLPADTDGWTVANFFQALKVPVDWISFLRKIVGGVLSAKALVIDGVGGAAAAGIAGALQVVTSIGGTVAPNAAPVRGVLYYDLIPFAVAHITVDPATGNPTLAWGVNIHDVAKAGSGVDGDYLVNFTSAAPGTDYAALATPALRNTGDFTAQAGAVTNAQAFVTIMAAGAPGHCSFNLFVWSK